MHIIICEYCCCAPKLYVWMCFMIRLNFFFYFHSLPFIIIIIIIYSAIFLHRQFIWILNICANYVWKIIITNFGCTGFFFLHHAAAGCSLKIIVYSFSGPSQHINWMLYYFLHLLLFFLNSVHVLMNWKHWNNVSVVHTAISMASHQHQIKQKKIQMKNK